MKQAFKATPIASPATRSLRKSSKKLEKNAEAKAYRDASLFMLTIVNAVALDKQYSMPVHPKSFRCRLLNAPNTMMVKHIQDAVHAHNANTAFRSIDKVSRNPAHMSPI